MKPRIRRLANLYHRWGRQLGLDAEQVAIALEHARLIERIDADRYRETVTSRKVSTADFEAEVSRILKGWVPRG